MELNFQARVKLICSFFFKYVITGQFGYKKSGACNVQSELDLHCTQKVITLRLAVQGLIHPKLKDVLSEKKSKRNKLFVYVFL